MMGKASRLPVSPVQFKAPAKPWENVGDFWNDPRRWDGIDDPTKTMFWSVRRPDVIDVRPAPKPAIDPDIDARQRAAMNAQQQAYNMGMMADYSDLLNAGAGSIVRLYRAI